MIRRPPRSTQSRSSAASDVYKRQVDNDVALYKHLFFSLPYFLLSNQPCVGEANSPGPSGTSDQRPGTCQVGSSAGGSGAAAGTALRSRLSRLDRFDSEDGVLGQVGERFEVAIESSAHVVAVGGHDPIALGTLNLNGAELLVSPLCTKLTLTSNSQVAHPLGLATPANEVSSPLEVKGRERSRNREAAPSTPNGKRRRPDGLEDRVHDVSHDEGGMNVLGWR